MSARGRTLPAERPQGDSSQLAAPVGSAATPVGSVRRAAAGPQAEARMRGMGLVACARRYEAVTSGQPERMVSGSDDFTMFLWTPSTSKKHVARMTGHVQTVNQVRPRWQVAALQRGQRRRCCGACLVAFAAAHGGGRRRASLRAQVCFSPDGRWILSASFDKSIKLWDGVKGTFVATFRAHVGPVYQVRAALHGASRALVAGCKMGSLMRVAA